MLDVLSSTRTVATTPRVNTNLHREARSIEYACQLMNRCSITPNDAGCQDWLIEKLVSLGFSCQKFEVEGVSNLVARLGNGPRHIAFLGHTDVVPPGPLDKWETDPFEATIRDGVLIGRGAADMKTGVAAMLAATERFLESNSAVNCSYHWLITSDEEGEAEHGSKWIKSYLDQIGVELDMCIVGEPTALKRTGDAIKVGRRGSLSGHIELSGKQGHVAYPQYAENAIHMMADVISNMQALQWDEGSEDFPGTSLQVTHVDSGAFTDNIVPGQCKISFNIRHSAQYSHEQLTKIIQATVSESTQQFTLSWDRPCVPYLTTSLDTGCLVSAVEKAIFQNTGSFPILSTSGGTSDGRFFASDKTQVLEVGVPNKTIHQVNERIHLSDLVTLEDIYTDVLSLILTN